MNTRLLLFLNSNGLWIANHVGYWESRFQIAVEEMILKVLPGDSAECSIDVRTQVKWEKMSSRAEMEFPVEMFNNFVASDLTTLKSKLEEVLRTWLEEDFEVAISFK